MLVVAGILVGGGRPKIHPFLHHFDARLMTHTVELLPLSTSLTSNKLLLDSDGRFGKTQPFVVTTCKNQGMIHIDVLFLRCVFFPKMMFIYEYKYTYIHVFVLR